MGIYKKGEQTEQELMKAARHLFYEKGFKNTYCSEITDYYHVNQGLFHYYFQNKANICSIIHTAFMEQLMGIAKDYLSQETELVKYTFDTVLLWKVLEVDEHIARFLAEMAEANVQLDSRSETWQRYIGSFNFVTVTDYTSEEIKLLADINFTSEMRLFHAYYTKKYDLSIDDYIRTDLELFFGLFDIDRKKIRTLIAEADELISRIEIISEGDFRVSIRRKSG